MSNLSMNMVLSCCLQRNKARGQEECFPVSSHDVRYGHASCASADIVQDGDIIPNVSQKIRDCTSEEIKQALFSKKPAFRPETGILENRHISNRTAGQS
ncbi:hypothetical protein HKD21_12265 [Gluconobacter cerevisiae]|uniref:Uncharacterized protein n=1 Tax=Gluconobacter cerevisiae TaxID=1379734 RepID=A0ABR9YG24_9PROT|nr:hypothetical protein [Gluconobacter cerevisiae]MBF0877615.1 hypothetical protein [Gluconobacter cerevisiae]